MSNLKRAFELFPKLGPQLKKGECGRIAVVGGALEYTGAPYFAAMAPMKIGADLSYVFCPPDAATVIKTYSPELIVHPTQSFEKIQGNLERVDSLVIGPGLGRDMDRLVPLMKNILNKVRSLNSLGVVVDADGLFVLRDCLDELKGLKNVILTPNHREFDRLYSQVFPESEEEKKTQEHVVKLAKELQVIVFLKGTEDVITDGQAVELGTEKGCDRRCGGQGDLLSGAIALFTYWAKLKAQSDEFKPEHFIQGAHAASDFIRFCSKSTFNEIGRSMNAADILAQIRHVVKQFDI